MLSCVRLRDEPLGLRASAKQADCISECLKKDFLWDDLQPSRFCIAALTRPGLGLSASSSFCGPAALVKHFLAQKS